MTPEEDMPALDAVAREAAQRIVDRAKADGTYPRRRAGDEL
jgi:hypothetical protein